MPLPVERLRQIVLAQVTDAETRACVVYLATEPVSRGEQLSFARLTLTCPTDGYLAFVDLDPAANWGHSCCYVFVDAGGDEVRRVNAQFPPFGSPASRAQRKWRVMYRAPGVPEALLMIPEP